MENIDLSAIEAKYPRAEFSVSLVDQHIDLIAEDEGKGHITRISAPNGATPEILMTLADGQYAYFEHHGIDLTDNKRGAEG